MIKIDKGNFEAHGTEMDVVIDCMIFIKSFNRMIERGDIKIDDFCCLNTQELQKFGDNVLNGIKKLEKQGWFEYMAGGDSNV